MVERALRLGVAYPGGLDPAPQEFLAIRGSGPPFLKAFAAKDRTALRGTERDGRLLSTLRARGGCLDPWFEAAASGGIPDGFAVLAALGFVGKPFFREKLLLSGGEDEIPSAVSALQDAVLEFWHMVLPSLDVGLPAPSLEGRRWKPKIKASYNGEAAERLLLFAPIFLAVSFSRQRLFHPALFTRLQVVGVPFDLLDNIFRLHFPLETAQGILEGFTLLKPDFSHAGNTPSYLN